MKGAPRTPVRGEEGSRAPRGEVPARPKGRSDGARRAPRCSPKLSKSQESPGTVGLREFVPDPGGYSRAHPPTVAHTVIE